MKSKRNMERKEKSQKKIIIEDIIEQGDRKRYHNLKIWLSQKWMKEILEIE